MQSNKLILLGFVILVVAAGLWFGCGGMPQADDNSSLEGRLRLLVLDDAGGQLAGAYVLGDGHTIYFQAVSGPAIEVDDGDQIPNLPRAEIDVRFYDSQGGNFILRAGGHALRDPAWTVQLEHPDPDLRAKDIVAVRAAVDALRDSEVPFGLADEREALVEVGSFFTSEDWLRGLRDTGDEREAEVVDGASTEPDVREMEQRDGIGRLELASHRGRQQCQTYTHRFELRKAPVQAYDGSRIDITIPLLDHSATISSVLDACGNQVSPGFETCNHGRCASALNFSCRRSWNNRGAVIPISSTCCREARSCADHCGVACCSTPYGAGSGNHVCNDDSKLQRDVMANNGAGFCAQYCGDRDNATRAPSCL